MPEGSGFLSPIVLPANQPDDRPYRGGEGIARFRGLPLGSPYTPEDFVASTTEVFGSHGVGVTTLPDGTSLRDAVLAHPETLLGPQHIEQFGPRTMLLTKLLDTAERLFVHYHPGDAFARERLGSTLGKTEAWAIIAARPGAHAHLGFSRGVTDVEAARWFEGQDVDDMLGAMNRVALAPGDTLLVPAGIPHSIGPGVTLVELQQPTDLSLLLEYRGFGGLERSAALLGLPLDEALRALDRTAWDAGRLDSLLSSAPAGPDSVQRLFPAVADDFFAAERVSVSGSQELEAAFAVLVVLEGAGELTWDSGAIPLASGMTVLIPFGAGPIELRGDLQVIRCLPPRPR